MKYLNFPISIPRLFRSFFRRASKGQTLIETIVAIGLLTTGVVGGLSLAIYTLGASDVTIKQIIATNLAREGIEVIRQRRDTNWLTGTLADCSAIMGAGQQCYLNWDSGIDGNPSQKKYRISFNPALNTWQIISPADGPNTRLYLQPNGVYTDVNNGNWVFSRQIIISEDSSPPFSGSNPRLRVTSQVWWVGKNCPATDNPDFTSCKVIVEDYLTNWKNY